MGYHDAREIPNYWTYAQNFVLQDNMFEPNSSWSWPEHLFMVSGWSARAGRRMERIRRHASAQSKDRRLRKEESKRRKVEIEHPYTGPTRYRCRGRTSPTCLHKYGVSWRYYVFEGSEPDCESRRSAEMRNPGSRDPRPRASGTRWSTSRTSKKTVRSATCSR